MKFLTISVTPPATPLYYVSVAQNGTSVTGQPTEAYLRTVTVQPYSSSFGGVCGGSEDSYGKGLTLTTNELIVKVKT